MPVATKPLSNRLREIEANIEQLRDDRVAAEAEARSAQETYAGLEDITPGSPEFEAAKEATRKVGELEDQIAGLTSEQVEVLRMMGQSPEQIARDKGHDPVSTRDAHDGWDIASLFTPEKTTRLAELAGSTARIGAREDLGEVISARDFAADITPSTNMRRGEFYGVLPQLRRPLTLLDIIPSGVMENNTLPYTREEGSFDGALETAELAQKPEVDWDYTDDEATARTVAALGKVPRQALEDVSALQGIIENRLRYMVLRRLEGQIAAGNGTPPNLRGILATSGRTIVEQDLAEIDADQILTGLTMVLLAEAFADAILVHPLNWMRVLKAKADAGGDGQYYGGGPFSVTPQVMWGTPLIPSQSVPLNKALVGDFGIGAQLFVRKGVQVLLSDSDGDDFRHNRVTVLAEGRFALPVWRPSAFAEVELATPASGSGS